MSTCLRSSPSRSAATTPSGLGGGLTGTCYGAPGTGLAVTCLSIA